VLRAAHDGLRAGGKDHPSFAQDGQIIFCHLGLLVAETAAVNAIKQRLELEGLVLVDEMNTTCCYAKQDKFWVRDPDDVEWEVYAITDDMLEFDSAKKTSEEAVAVACCRD
jgi:hypothetical protein